MNFLLGLARRLARFERTVTLDNWRLTNNPTPVHMKLMIKRIRVETSCIVYLKIII
ncbi:MAG: hypothetical protein AAF936_08455 [Pseudomonadota bacterium]